MRGSCCFGRAAVLAFVITLPACLGFASSASQHHRSRTDKDLSRIGHRQIARGLNLFRQDEPELGKEYSVAYEQSTKVLHDPAVSDYLERLEQALVRNSDADLPITLRVIDSQQVTALTLLGGHQYVSLGLLLRMESGGELAAMLARGIAHTALHSATRELTMEQLAEVANIPVIFVGSSVPPSGTAVPTVPLTLASFMREDERDADFFGVQYAYKAGYDPACFVRALQSAWADEESSQVSTAKAFRPLPPLAERIDAVEKEIRELMPARAGSVVTTPEFEAFREHLRTLKPVIVPQSSGNEHGPELAGK